MCFTGCLEKGVVPSYEIELQPLISARRSTEEWVSQNWAAVAKAINERVTELGWRQRELAKRSHVSQAVIRELQHHTVERRRSARTLEALSTALGWHPQHLDAVLQDRHPPEPDDPATQDGQTVWSRLDALERRLIEITQSLDDMRTDMKTVIGLVAEDR